MAIIPKKIFRISDDNFLIKVGENQTPPPPQPVSYLGIFSHSFSGDHPCEGVEAMAIMLRKM